MPFGFSNSDDDPDRDKNAAGGNPFGGGDMPFGFGAGGEGFDPAQLGQMLTQFGQMLSGMGSSMGQGGTSGPVNYDIAKKLARQQIGSVTPITEATSRRSPTPRTWPRCGWTPRQRSLPERAALLRGLRTTGSTTRSTPGSDSVIRWPRR